MSIFKPILVLAISAILYMSYVSLSAAPATFPPHVNGAYPSVTNNLVDTYSGTKTSGTLYSIGLNQGITFDFTGSVDDSAFWDSGLSFFNSGILQVQLRDSGLSANFATNTINFSDDVYGLQFTKGGLDNGDKTTISFFHHGVPVPVGASAFVDGMMTVSCPNNVIEAAGENVDISGVGESILAAGDGNNDTGGIATHEAQEQFTINLPIGVAVDQVVFNQTGKKTGISRNVTLIYTDFAWAKAPDQIAEAQKLTREWMEKH